MSLKWSLQDTVQCQDATESLHQEMKFLRFLSAMPAALAATLLLVWGMERLIHAGEAPPLVEPPIYKVPDPVLPTPKPPEILYKKPEPPKPADVEPAPPELNLALNPPDSAAPPAFAPPAPPDSQGFGGYANDMPVPTMLVQPVYPAGAANKGIEGYVDVQFDVAASGATDNIVVIAAVPPDVFNRETVKAVKRWKFNPVVKDGKAIPYKGLVQRVHFEMQKP